MTALAGSAIQVRAKAADRKTLERLAAAARACSGETSVPLLLNGPAELAARLGYDGVNWPERKIPAARANSGALKSAGGRRGSSVHSGDALLRAERAGAEFAVFGPVFSPGSKAAPGVGLKALRALAAASRIPVLAIGGVTPERVAACIEAGASGVGVVSGLFGAGAVEAQLDSYGAALKAAGVSLG